MMKTLLLLLSIFCSTIIVAQENSYNKQLADSLGADDYGMKGYVLVLLSTGPDTADTKEEQTEIFMGHLNNINKLADEGTLILAGPIGKNENQYRGLFVLNVKSTDEAKIILQSDPAVAKGILSAALYNWYGSAALPTYLNYHKQIEKTKP